MTYLLDTFVFVFLISKMSVLQMHTVGNKLPSLSYYILLYLGSTIPHFVVNY